MGASFKGFRSLVENSPDAISLINTNGQILYGSESTTKIFGYRPDEIVGRNCLDLMHPEDRDRSNLALKEVLAEPEGPLQWHLRVLHKDGNYCWVESTVSNLLLESEVQAIVMQQRDIHARKAAEAEKQQHAEELARSNLRLEEFAHHAAHDLREPLLAVSLYAQLLLRKIALDPNAQQMAEAIVASTARMHALVGNLLAFASAGALDSVQWVDLQAAADDATQNLALCVGTSGAKITIESLPSVRGNGIEMVRIFQNLIGNAVKYSGVRPVEIRVTSHRKGPFWVIRVEDNGLGVAKENQTRIFAPFVRVAPREIEGTGLGLALCKKIVEDQGGTIWVESEPGMGSTFCFTIAAEKEENLISSKSHSDLV